MRNTNGKVKEFTFHGAITLLKPRRTHVDSMAKNTIDTHISHESGEMKVGKAQPTRMPLKPHRPCSPSEGFSFKSHPAAVDATRPSTAPQPTAGLPVAYEPQKIPIKNIRPVHHEP